MRFIDKIKKKLTEEEFSSELLNYCKDEFQLGGFDEDERYGIYEYDYFFLENNKVRHIQIRDKEYTKDYNGKFNNLMLYCEIEELEKYYDSLFEQKNLVKKTKK